MAEIGSLLRDTRMRERIDITTVESATKIRAKYLRALENEEWDQLPGPTFVRTFLRTYGDYLGLDSKMLVEDYKQRFERPAPQDLMPFGGRSASSGGRRPPRPSRGIPPWALIAVVVVVLIGVLFLIGSLGGDSGSSDEATVTATPTATPSGTSKPAKKHAQKVKKKKRKPATPAKPKQVSLQLVPEAPVYTCLEGADGQPLIDRQILTTTSQTYRARRLSVTFGNGRVSMRVNGKSYAVPDTSGVVGYSLAPGAAPKQLTSGLPTCTA